MFKVAIILSGGKGERMKPLTNSLPKALVEYKQKALIKYGIDFLKVNSIDFIYVTYSYQANVLFKELNKHVNGFINTTDKENSFFLFNSFLNSMNDNILVLPCDIVIDIDLNQLMEDFLLLGEPAIMIVPTTVKSGIDGDFISYNSYNNCITKLDRSEKTNIYASGLQVINLNKINKFKINFDNFSYLWHFLMENNELKVSNIHPKFWNCFDELDQLNKY